MDYEKELVLFKNKEYHIEYNGGKFNEKESSEYVGSGVRVIKDRKIGFSYCTTNNECYNAESEALKSLKYSKMGNYEFVSPGKYPRPETLGKTIENPDTKSIVKEIALATKYANTRGVSVVADVSLSKTYLQIENSNGLDDAYRKTNMTVFVEGKLKNIASAYAYKSQIDKVDIFPILKEAVDKTLFLSKGVKLDRTNYPVVFNENALGSLFGLFINHISGKTVRTGASLLGNKLGKKVASNQLTITDSGLRGGVNVQPYDDEGVPSRDRVLIKNGILVQYLYDMEEDVIQKGRINFDELGFCSRSSPISTPSINTSNVIIDAGNHNFVDEFSEYIVIDSFHGMHTANATTGDFGVSVIAAWIEGKNGKTPLRSFSLSGNVFDIFMDAILDKKQETSGSLTTPRFLTRAAKIVQ